jgi:hypothetical protein
MDAQDSRLSEGATVPNMPGYKNVCRKGKEDELGRARNVVGHTAEDLSDHPEIAVSVEVRDVNAVELAAENRTVPPFARASNAPSQLGVATAMWWTPSTFSAKKRTYTLSSSSGSISSHIT